MPQTTSIGADKENVLIRAGACSVTLLPQLGGKVASIVVNGRELLQTPLAPPEPRTRTISFDQSDASGWDECLPSVAACTIATAAGKAHIPDHGDLWRVEWQQVPESRNPDRPLQDAATSVALRGECFSLPLVLERTLTLREKEGGWLLAARYELTNTGSVPVPWAWAAHPLFLAEPGDRIVLPNGIHSLRVEGSGGNRLGKAGGEVSWPIAALSAGGETDLSLALPPESGVGDKLFTAPVTHKQNWCALQRPSAGVTIRVSFDAEATPYIGLWICYGGWPDRPGPKQTCVALEPATAPVDSLAQTGPWSRTLDPGTTSAWLMDVDIDKI